MRAITYREGGGHLILAIFVRACGVDDLLEKIR